MKTRVILREDIPSLGEVGEVVQVASGYARNHLLPLGKAYLFSEDGMRRVEKDRERAQERRLAMMAEHEALAARIRATQLTFEERVSEEGHLYGSVNAHRIAAALAAEGLEIGERNIRLDEPLREVGEYTLAVHVHGDLEAELKVWVVASQAATEA